MTPIRIFISSVQREFALVDQAVDFVLSKIALSVGTRTESVQAPVQYEILTASWLSFARIRPRAAAKIAATLGTTRSIVRYRLDKLRAAGKIERVGPDKSGYWKVLGESAV